jgi:predicted nucleic acid-binding protein
LTDEAPIVLDACVCLNLAAALDGELAGLLGWIPYVVPQVVAEALSLHDRVDGQVVATPVSLQGLAVTSLTDEETAMYVDLARRLDDGEAASMAVAGHRRWLLCTDDKAARRTASLASPPIVVLTTPTVIRRHTQLAGWSPSTIAQALRAVEEHAAFLPPRDDPDWDWWVDSRSALPHTPR